MAEKTLAERMKAVTAKEKAAGVHYTQTGKPMITTGSQYAGQKSPGQAKYKVTTPTATTAGVISTIPPKDQWPEGFIPVWDANATYQDAQGNYQFGGYVWQYAGEELAAVTKEPPIIISQVDGSTGYYIWDELGNPIWQEVTAPDPKLSPLEKWQIATWGQATEAEQGQIALQQEQLALQQKEYQTMTPYEKAGLTLEQQQLAQQLQIAQMPYQGMTAEQQATMTLQQQQLVQEAQWQQMPYEQMTAQQQAEQTYLQQQLAQQAQQAQMPYQQMTAQQQAEQTYLQQQLAQQAQLAQLPYQGMTAQQQAEMTYLQQQLAQQTQWQQLPYQQMTVEQQAEQTYLQQQLAQQLQLAQMPYQGMTAEQQAYQAYLQQQLQATTGLQQQTLAQQLQLAQMPYQGMTAYEQATTSQQQQNYLAQLAAQPKSWLEYAAASGATPAIQPWMMPLMPQQYQQMGAGQAIPGYGGTSGMTQMPALTTPSRQYEARMGPTAAAQYQGYEQARTGITPEELQWRLWSQAPPSGKYQPMSYGR